MQQKKIKFNSKKSQLGQSEKSEHKELNKQ